jgi:superfamily I DNA/RNA helicase
MIDILTEFNPVQRVTIEAISGPLLILAGSGSGKTRVIAHQAHNQGWYRGSDINNQNLTTPMGNRRRVRSRFMNPF